MKKILVSLLTVSLLLETSSLSFAKPTKVRQGGSKGTKKAAKKKDTTGAKRSGSSKSNSSSSSRKSSRSASKRAAGLRAAAVAAVASGNAVEQGVTETSTASTKASNCRTAYSECMDIQVKGILSKYAYIGEDPAVEAIQETGDPLRCVYYYKDDVASQNLLKASQKTVKSENFDSKISKNAKDVNALYYAYNFYCKPELGVGEAGQPINECQWDTSNNVYATKKSYAFYKEAFDRLQADELTILNFTSTSLYQNKIKGMVGDDFDVSKHSVSPSDVSDMLSQLGLDTSTATSDKTLFSVNVAPPVGAGTLNPKGVFQKAHEICMGNGQFPTTASSGLGESDLNDLKKHVKVLSSTSCQSLNDEYIAYYQEGKWEGCPSGYKYSSTDDTCVSKTDKEETAELTEVDTGFLSAAKSCASLEQSLISSRDQMYAKFQDQLTNYLNDNLAKLIKKEAKNESVITNAVSNLYTADAENKSTIVKAKTEAEKTKLLTEVETKKIKADAQVQQAEADAQIAEAQAKTIESKAKAAEIKSEAMKKLVEANKSKLNTYCGELASSVKISENVIKEVNHLAVCVAENGTLSTAQNDDCGEGMYVSCITDLGFSANEILTSLVDSATEKTEISIDTSGSLQAGFYRLEMAGGSGSSGGSVNTIFCHKSGGSGGGGEVIKESFALDKPTAYTFTPGHSPAIKIGSVINKVARGGGNGSSAGYCHGGNNGASFGPNYGVAYIKLYKLSN